MAGRRQRSAKTPRRTAKNGDVLRQTPQVFPKTSPFFVHSPHASLYSSPLSPLFSPHVYSHPRRRRSRLPTCAPPQDAFAARTGSDFRTQRHAARQSAQHGRRPVQCDQHLCPRRRHRCGVSARGAPDEPPAARHPAENPHAVVGIYRRAAARRGRRARFPRFATVGHRGQRPAHALAARRRGTTHGL